MKRTVEFISFAVTDQGALSVARLIADPGFVSWIPARVDFDHEIISMFILPRLQAKLCVNHLLPRKSFVRLNDRLDRTIAVDRDVKHKPNNM